MNMKNSGSAAATVEPTSVMYNGMPDTYYTGTSTGFTWTWTPAGSSTMVPGATTSAKIDLSGTAFKSGMTLEITLHTTGGKDYPKVVTLP